MSPLAHLLSSGPALAEPVAGAVGQGGQGGARHGARVLTAEALADRM